jgi:hypothetical protein
MFFKLFFGLLILAALGSAAWYFRDDPDLRRFMRMQQAAPGLPAGAAPSGAASAAPPAGLHKCRSGGRVDYSSDPCPPGSVEQPIKGGAVTVVPGQAPASAPAEKSKPPLNQAMEKLSR